MSSKTNQGETKKAKLDKDGLPITEKPTREDSMTDTAPAKRMG
jgi:hypothetical protein